MMRTWYRKWVWQIGFFVDLALACVALFTLVLAGMTGAWYIFLAVMVLVLLVGVSGYVTACAVKYLLEDLR